MAASEAARSVSVKVGKLNLVDLAGSERVHITGATGVMVACMPSPLCTPLGACKHILKHCQNGSTPQPSTRFPPSRWLA